MPICIGASNQKASGIGLTIKIMKLRVNVKKYSLYKYPAYLRCAFEIPRPEGEIYEVGDVIVRQVCGREELSVILGCITSDQVRIDFDGMVDRKTIRPAKVSDLDNSSYAHGIYKNLIV